MQTSQSSAVIQPFKPTGYGSIPHISADAWFSGGQRVTFNRDTKMISPNPSGKEPNNSVAVYKKIIKDAAADKDTPWTSFLPGWPDGSYGWAKTNHQLADASIGHRLFFDYVGHGESDKPVDYPYSTDERADLVEALWKAEGIQSTFIIGFDYSSIVALELLSRQQDRLDAGEHLSTRIEGALLINGGLYGDGHTHPWYTTPILKTNLGTMATWAARRSNLIFKELVKPLWSKDFKVTKEEYSELFQVINRRNGMHILHSSADFVDHHKEHDERLNLSRIFHNAKGSLSLHVVGSTDDPFEGQQAKLAKARLGTEGLDVRILKGGHLSTSEQPELLADIIRDVVPQSHRVQVAQIRGADNPIRLGAAQ